MDDRVEELLTQISEIIAVLDELAAEDENFAEALSLAEDLKDEVEHNA